MRAGLQLFLLARLRSFHRLIALSEKVLSQLNLTLLSKSDLYSDAGVRVLFRLNNSNHVLKSLQRCALLELVSLSEPECQDTYLKMICTHKKNYLQWYVWQWDSRSLIWPTGRIIEFSVFSWNKVLNYVTNVDDIQLYYGKLKDKEKNVLKERFSVGILRFLLRTDSFRIHYNKMQLEFAFVPWTRVTGQSALRCFDVSIVQSLSHWFFFQTRHPNTERFLLSRSDNQKSLVISIL